MLIIPNWPAPARVKAVATTRIGGVSEAPYRGFNLGDHVGDRPDDVAANRKALQQQLGLASPLPWLNQIHSTKVLSLDGSVPASVEVDGSYTSHQGMPCVVMTADCLPVLLCDKAGTQVAAVHAGWRGLVDGIIENALAEFSVPGGEIMAWLGPAISQAAFEVGGEVREQFVAHDPAAEAAFTAHGKGKWLADLYLLARQRLQRQGVIEVYGGEYCTFSEPDRFFSYRRDGVTGRQASLIWLDAES